MTDPARRGDGRSEVARPTTGPGARHDGFVDRPPDEFPKPDVNPYLRLHRQFGPPVIVGEDAPAYRGRWSEAFPAAATGTGGTSRRPLHVEIGSGNGFYLSGMAAAHPERDWLGVEIRFKRIVLTARKLVAVGVENARITRYDAWFLDDIFAPAEIDALHVHFADPWTKGRHAKNRLLGPHFAAWAARALAVGGRLRSKTDHRPNLERLVDAASGLPFRVVARSNDQAGPDALWVGDDVITNYESKFRRKGEPVYAVELERVADR